MDPIAYSRMADNEQRHWWFSGRRAILAALLRRELAQHSQPIRILEAGCGSGGNLDMLTTFGAVDAVEFDAGARAIAARRSGIPVQACVLPHDLPVRDGAYDLIVLLDVLEHIEDDQATLCALRRKLKQDGRLLVTVPAMPWLWSHHDELHHHKRRYTKRSLKLAAAAAEFKIAHIGYFNTFLFPIALVRRLIAIIYSRPTQDDRMPTRLLNAILSRIFSSERHIIGRAGLPVGLSLYAVLSDGR